MSNLARYNPGPDIEVIDAEVITIDLAPVEAKHELAKRAWDSLPLEQRWPDNLSMLKQAVTTDPKGFLELCRSEGLQVDFDLVINYHHQENHHHYHQDGGGLTREDLWAMAEAMRPQEPALTAADVLAIMQAHQPQQQHYSPPTYYPPPPTHITFSPHIEVSSHSEQDNSGSGRSVFFIVAIWALLMIAIVGGVNSD